MAVKKTPTKAKAIKSIGRVAKMHTTGKKIRKKVTASKASKATNRAVTAKVKDAAGDSEVSESVEMAGGAESTGQVRVAAKSSNSLTTVGTKYLTKEEALTLRKWWIVDATDKVVGRLATQIATILRGKNKAQFTPNQDVGDFVIVTNTGKLVFTGNKLDAKRYYRHSRFFGSLKEKSARIMMQEDPNFILKQAVKNMLPKNRLSRHLLAKLKLFSGPDHTHKSQKPEAINLK